MSNKLCKAYNKNDIIINQGDEQCFDEHAYPDESYNNYDKQTL